MSAGPIFILNATDSEGQTDLLQLSRRKVILGTDHLVRRKPSLSAGGDKCLPLARCQWTCDAKYI